jgi:hypothetical protein
MKILLFAVLACVIALGSAPACAENGISIDLKASAVSQDPNTYSLYCNAFNLGSTSGSVGFVTELMKDNVTVATGSLEANIPANAIYTQPIELPTNGYVPAGMYMMRVTASLGSSSDDAVLIIWLDDLNNIVSYVEKPIVGVEQGTWGSIKTLFP